MSEIHANDQSSNHHYRTELPNIIFQLGLTSLEFFVYAAIKKVAGDAGNCTQSAKTLAKTCHCSDKTIYTTIKKLCLVNPIINKPLLICVNRKHEHGDKDTNFITIVDIWPKNYETRGGTELRSVPTEPGSPPTEIDSVGVRNVVPKGTELRSYKEEPFKKNLLKKATTPTSSKSKVAVEAASSEKIEDEDRKSAKALKAWIDKESEKIRRIKKGPGYYENSTWGKDWVMPLETYEFFIKKYGVKYFHDQLNHMGIYQDSFDKGKGKKGIEKPESFLKLACRDNYANSLNEKK